MALSATVAFEVRPANGTTNAGGGFNASGSSPGTDYSQQNSVQVAFDGATISATTSGVTTTILITGYAAAATDNRNLLAITGGTNFITGIYEIVSVSAGVSGVGTWTLDRNCTTGVGAAMTGNMGGARSGFSVGTTPIQGAYVAGNKFWVKNEAWNETVNCSVAGATGTPNVLEGYNTARGDAPLGSSRPTNDKASGAGVGITTAQDTTIKYLIAKSAASHGFAPGTSRTTYVNCRATANGGSGFNTNSNSCNLYACEADSNSAWGDNNSSGSRFGCEFRSNTSGGFNFNSNGGNVVNCLIYANTGTGINSIGASGLVTNNTINGNTGASSDGYNDGGNPRSAIFINNIFSNNGRYGANVTSGIGPELWADYNDFFGNATAARNNFPTGPHDSTADPQFANTGAGDFSIGTNLAALGWPGAFPRATSTGYMDIGAVQRQAGSGSAGMLFIPDMAGT